MNRPVKKYWNKMTKKEWIAACRAAVERAKLPRAERPVAETPEPIARAPRRETLA